MPAAVSASPRWYAACKTLVPVPYAMMSGTSASSHGPPYPMSFAETSPSANSRPADRPSVAARPNLVGWTIRSTARPAHAASQMIMPTAGGCRSRASLPASESPSRISPDSASTTANCSRRASLDGCPRAVAKARTATPDAVTAWTRASGASRRAATYISHPVVSAINAFIHRRSWIRKSTVRNGRRGDSRGKAAAASCSSE